MAIGRLKSVEAWLAAGASLVAVVLQYFAIPEAVDIPSNVSPLYQYLTTGLLLLFVFIALLLLDHLARSEVWLQVVIVLAIGGAGLWAGISLVNQIDAQGRVVACTDFEGSKTILVTDNPSEELGKQLALGGSVERGWCNHPQKPLFRALVRQESIKVATAAGLKLLAAQLLLGFGLILAALLVTMRRRAGGQAGVAAAPPPPPPPAPTPPSSS